jgi:acetyl esterase/lipase
MKRIVPSAFGLMTCLVSFLSAWILLPAPIYSLLPLSVGAPEVSPTLLGVIVLLLLAYLVGQRLMPIGRKWQSRAIIIGISWSLVVSALPLLQVSGAQKQAEQYMQAAAGSNYLQSISPALRDQLRSHPLVWQDLWRDITAAPVRIDRQIPFAQIAGVTLKMNIYRPAKVGKYPGIISIYGGAWQRGSPNGNEDFNRYMAARGYVVWAIDYRHAPTHRFPAQIEDVRSALQYIQEQAAAMETDLSRMTVFGRSAGAHLGLIAGYSWQGFPIKAVVDYYSPVDLSVGYYLPPVPDPINSKAVLRSFFGGDPQQFPAEYQQGSPINYVKPGLPPTLLVYGGKDRIVESKYGKYLADNLISKGNKAVFIEIPWADHAFDEVFSGPSNQLALYYTERFLAWAVS